MTASKLSNEAQSGLPLLSIRNLSIQLPTMADRALAVSDVSIDINPSEIHCVVGESGSGKTMTANAVIQLLPEGLKIASGQIILDGEDLVKLSRKAMRQLRGQKIGMIFQDPMSALNPLRTIGDQIAEMLLLHTDMRGRAVADRVTKLLEDVRIPDPRATMRAYPHQISGGQRQRAMIAMALALDPKLLIADEPTTALDVTTQAQILELILDLQKRHGTSVLFITHDFGVVSEIADRVTVMKGGRVVESSTAEEVLHRPSQDYTRKLLDAIPSLDPKAPVPDVVPPSLLKVEAVAKTYDSGGWFGRGRRVEALKSVSVEVPRGLTTGIVGESGSGKSTLARCVVGLTEFNDGSISIDGFPVTRDTRRTKELGKRIQMVFQDPYSSLNPRRTVGDLISQGPIVHGVPRRVAEDRARGLLERVGLGANVFDRYPHEFSGGQRQRVGLARALAMEPELIVADEAVSALDVSIQAQVLELLANLQQEFKLTLLFITHDLRVTAQICQRIAVMKAGEVVEQGWTRDVLANPVHPYTQMLFSSVSTLKRPADT